MQIVRDTRINKTTDNKWNLYDDPLMALVGLVEMFGKYINYNTRMKGTNENSPRGDVDAHGDEENSR